MRKFVPIALLLFTSAFASASPQVSFEDYVNLAESMAHRCVEPRPEPMCSREIEVAFEAGTIDQTTRNWSKVNGFFPVLDRWDRLMGVCPCG